MDLILKAILSHSSTFPNDLNELLHLMRSDGHKNIYIPLIPLDNIRETFLKMHLSFIVF